MGTASVQGVKHLGVYVEVPYPLLFTVDLAEEALLVSTCARSFVCLSCLQALFFSLAALTATAFFRAWSAGVTPCLKRIQRQSSDEWLISEGAHAGCTTLILVNEPPLELIPRTSDRIKKCLEL